jgi:FkbM family methyltransferase
MVRGSHDIFFVQVGAMDGVSFDPLHKYVVQHKWRGLMVEPLSDMFEELKETYRGMDGLIFENVAVADTSGQMEMCRIRKEAIKLGIVPNWAKGISTHNTEPRNELRPKSPYIEQLRPHIVTETVRCNTLANLLSKHGIKHIDIFVTDVEGYDYNILRQLDFAQYKPRLILIEWSELSDSDKRMAVELLTNHGYRTKVVHIDLVAWYGIGPGHLHWYWRKVLEACS